MFRFRTIKFLISAREFSLKYVKGVNPIYTLNSFHLANNPFLLFYQLFLTFFVITIVIFVSHIFILKKYIIIIYI